MTHPLHSVIGNFIQQLALPANSQRILARECGGPQNIPLFCSPQKANENEYCNVDILIVVDEKIRLIIEIEESGLIPTKICGKFLTSALSTHFIHDVVHNKPTLMGEAVTFIQVLDSSRLDEDHTRKIKQGKALELSIQAIIPVRGSTITKYHLFYIQGVAEFRSINARQAELEQIVKAACSIAA